MGQNPYISDMNGATMKYYTHPDRLALIHTPPQCNLTEFVSLLQRIKKIKHPHCCELLEFESFQYELKPTILTVHLHPFKPVQHLNQTKFLEVTKQILEGVLKYIEINSGHFDLRVENILMNEDQDKVYLVPPYHRIVPDDHYGLASYLIAVLQGDPAIQKQIYSAGVMNWSSVNNEMSKIMSSRGKGVNFVLNMLLKRQCFYTIKQEIEKMRGEGEVSTPLKFHHRDRASGINLSLGEGGEAGRTNMSRSSVRSKSRNKHTSGINLSLNKKSYSYIQNVFLEGERKDLTESDFKPKAMHFLSHTPAGSNTSYEYSPSISQQKPVNPIVPIPSIRQKPLPQYTTPPQALKYISNSVILDSQRRASLQSRNIVKPALELSPQIKQIGVRDVQIASQKAKPLSPDKQFEPTSTGSTGKEFEHIVKSVKEKYETYLPPTSTRPREELSFSGSGKKDSLNVGEQIGQGMTHWMGNVKEDGVEDKQKAFEKQKEESLQRERQKQIERKKQVLLQDKLKKEQQQKQKREQQDKRKKKEQQQQKRKREQQEKLEKEKKRKEEEKIHKQKQKQFKKPQQVQRESSPSKAKVKSPIKSSNLKKEIYASEFKNSIPSHLSPPASHYLQLERMLQKDLYDYPPYPLQRSPVTSTPLIDDYYLLLSDHAKAKAKNKDKPEYVKDSIERAGIYQGWKLNGLRHGIGRLQFSDGASYSGNWENGHMHGKGVLTYHSGKLAYDGDWVKDQFEGKGILFHEDPIQKAGPLDSKDLRHVLSYCERYEGEFRKDMMDGMGTMYFTNGEHYCGQFKQDKIHGEGTFKGLEGQLTGIWKDGRFQQK